MMPVDLKREFGQQYRIGLDEAATSVPGGKKDPWYYVVPCKYGGIYPFSDNLLAVHSKGPGIRQKSSALEGLTCRNRSDDGEAVFLFPPALFERVGEIVKPRRLRRLSSEHRKKLSESGLDYRFRSRSAVLNAEKQGKNRAIFAEAMPEVGK